MSIFGKIGNTSAPLTGTQEDRQERLDELCRSLDRATDLAALKTRAAAEGKTFKDVFKGWNKALREPTVARPENGGAFAWYNQHNGNPAMLAGNPKIEDKDQLTTTFMLNNVELQWQNPYHYRTMPARHSAVFGVTKTGNDAVAIQGNWQTTINGEWRSWWAYTAIVFPTGDVEAWFHDFISLQWGVNTYEEYVEMSTEIRDKAAKEYENNQEEAEAIGNLLAESL